MNETTADTPYAASGRQFEIRHGDAVATVVEVGGGLRTYRVGDREVLDGFDIADMASGGRGQHLLPWPNRLRDGAYTWDGRHIQAALNDFPHRHAAHGLTRWMNWVAGERTESAVIMHLHLHPVQGYPFDLALSARHELSDAGLTVTVTARNVGPDAAPFAYAPHPYLLSGSGAPVDVDLLHVPAETCVLPDEVGINTVRARCEGSEFDFRAPRALGELAIDTTFTDFTRDNDGRGRVRFAAASDRTSVAVWFDGAFSWAQIYSGDTLPDPAARRRSLAIEPMTAPANAFVTGEDVVRLEPGQQWTGSWGIELE